MAQKSRTHRRATMPVGRGKPKGEWDEPSDYVKATGSTYIEARKTPQAKKIEAMKKTRESKDGSEFWDGS